MPPEVAHILADSGARALVHTDGRSKVVDSAAAAATVAKAGQCPLLVVQAAEANRAGAYQPNGLRS
jgi:hypothetical protein